MYAYSMKTVIPITIDHCLFIQLDLSVFCLDKLRTLDDCLEDQGGWVAVNLDDQSGMDTVGSHGMIVTRGHVHVRQKPCPSSQGHTNVHCPPLPLPPLIQLQLSGDGP